MFTSTFATSVSPEANVRYVKEEKRSEKGVRRGGDRFGVTPFLLYSLRRPLSGDSPFLSLQSVVGVEGQWVFEVRGLGLWERTLRLRRLYSDAMKHWYKSLTWKTPRRPTRGTEEVPTSLT